MAAKPGKETIIATNLFEESRCYRETNLDTNLTGRGIKPHALPK